MEPVCTLSTKNTAVIYARVSSVGDRQSTERQVKDLSDYALYKQLEVRKVFEEHISGAKKNEERPVLQLLRWNQNSKWRQAHYRSKWYSPG